MYMYPKGKFNAQYELDLDTTYTVTKDRAYHGIGQGLPTDWMSLS